MRNEKGLSLLELEFVGNADDNFEEALKEHIKLHEGMSLFDLLKFLYQSSLGSFHLLEMMDEAKTLNWIKKNLEIAQPSDGPLIEELYGKKWVRLNFGPYKKTHGNDYQRIFMAFTKARKMKKEQPAKFLKLLERLIDAFRKKKIRFIKDEPRALSMVLTFMKDYKKKNCPPVHHSKSYILKNSPDYLVVPRSSLNGTAGSDQSESNPVVADALPIDDIVKHAVEFHGHLGPFLVLGVRAGLIANSRLGKDCFKTRATVTTYPRPPNSCFVDGIQITTGCTMGKCNIKLRKGKPTSVLFTKESRRLRIEVKKETLKEIDKIKSEREAEKEATRLLDAPLSELFETTIIESD